jgi:hypothetical protein
MTKVPPTKAKPMKTLPFIIKTNQASPSVTRLS